MRTSPPCGKKRDFEGMALKRPNGTRNRRAAGGASCAPARPGCSHREGGAAGRAAGCRGRRTGGAGAVPAGQADCSSARVGGRIEGAGGCCYAEYDGSAGAVLGAHGGMAGGACRHKAEQGLDTSTAIPHSRQPKARKSRAGARGECRHCAEPAGLPRTYRGTSAGA